MSSWSEILQPLHAAADAVALAAAFVLAWAALFVVGPVLCAAVVLARAAGHPSPADAHLLFYGTAAAWLLAFVATVTTRAIRATWVGMRTASASQAAADGRATGARVRRVRRRRGAAASDDGPNPFAFSWKDPWAAWAEQRLRDEAEARRSTRGGHETHRRAESEGRRHRRPRPEPRRDAPRPAPPPPAPDPHVVLGVPKGASQDAIRKAYRALVKKYHPDRVHDMAPEFRKVAHQKTLEIRAAYDALVTPRSP